MKIAWLNLRERLFSFYNFKEKLESTVDKCAMAMAITNAATNMMKTFKNLAFRDILSFE
jgi:hypothetical protein